MRILVAPDKFKGSCSAEKASLAIKDGLILYNKSLEIQTKPMADGGEGSLEVVSQYLDFEKIFIQVENPLGKTIRTFYLLQEDKAYIEMSKASGLTLLDENEQNPMHTSSFGTGQLIVDALGKGVTEINLFIGGSATNDAAIGIAAALGFKFLDKNNNVLPPLGSSLLKIKAIQNENIVDLENLQFTILCDVENSFHGPEGAAFTFAKQKGASESEIILLDDGLRNFARVIKKQMGIDISKVVGSGAAGGVGGGMMALFNANLDSGIERIFKLGKLDKCLEESDFVISGEGFLDHQSFSGKVIGGLAKICKKYQKPLGLLVGDTNLPQSFQKGLYIDTIVHHAQHIIDAKNNPEYYLRKMAFELAKSFKY